MLPALSFGKKNLGGVMIRVLQISYDMGLGGAETLIMNIYRHIDRSKIQFDFLLHSPTESAYEKEIKELGGKIYRIKRYLGYNKLSYARNLKKFLNAHPEYNIIHDHLMNSASETFKVANKLGRITVAHSHIVESHWSPAFFFYKNLWKIAKYRFACSDAAGKWLYRNKADFIVLRNGIETAKFAYNSEIRNKIRLELGIDDTTFLIGNIGRMVKQKNQLRLLDIFNEVLKKKPESKLIIIGDGPDKPMIEKKITELNLKNNVILAGLRTNVNQIMMAMDAFLFPSLFEGLGIVLVEAQASGLPCFFTNTIPKEADINNDLVYRIDLKESNETWANKLLSAKVETKREDAWKIVKDNGYDISDSASKLQSFYLDVASNINVD